jgi:hypothetical protein
MLTLSMSQSLTVLSSDAVARYLFSIHWQSFNPCVCSPSITPTCSPLHDDSKCAFLSAVAPAISRPSPLYRTDTQALPPVVGNDDVSLKAKGGSVPTAASLWLLDDEDDEDDEEDEAITNGNDAL